MDYNSKFIEEFNLLLVDTFHNILKTEMKLINKVTLASLSMREMHLIELVSEDDAITISKIAKKFDITLASVTVMVNKLVASGYLSKKKCENDARNTFVQLTLLGQRINEEHINFHKKMVDNVCKNLTDTEREVMYKGLKTLNELFNDSQLE